MDDRYCMYLRKSREDRELESNGATDTLKRHREILYNLAESRNIEIDKIYEEVVSGDTIEDRPQMKQLLSDVEDNMWAGVLVIEIERLARGDTTDQGIVTKAFKYSSTKIITPLKTYNPDNEFDEEFLEFGLFMSRREYKTINRRLQRGRHISIKEGKYVGSVAPYGYCRKKIEKDKGYLLEEDKKEADIVRTIFDLYAYKDYSVIDIARKLNQLEIKPRKKDKWSDSTLRDILNNPVYIGKIKWNTRKQEIKMKNGQKKVSRPRNLNGEIYEGLHKPIIDKITWDIVQNKRKQNKPSLIHNNVIKNPLVGLVYCGKCGRPMQRRPYNLKEKEDTLICTNTNCNNVSSKLSLVEEKIMEALSIWLANCTIDVNKTDNKFNSYEQLYEQCKKQITEEEKKLTKIQELLEEGIYSKEEYLNRAKVIKNKIDKLKASKEDLSKVINREQEAQSVVEKTETCIKNVLEGYKSLKTAEQKNLLLKTVIQKVEYIKEEKAIRKDSNPLKFDLHFYPKIPKI